MKTAKEVEVELRWLVLMTGQTFAVIIYMSKYVKHVIIIYIPGILTLFAGLLLPSLPFFFFVARARDIK